MENIAFKSRKNYWEKNFIFKLLENCVLAFFRAKKLEKYFFSFLPNKRIFTMY
jgi:hypothetical protein